VKGSSHQARGSVRNCKRLPFGSLHWRWVVTLGSDVG
jgi:hypothetical protein